MLLFLSKAEIIKDDSRKSIRTVGGAFPWPSVIRLTNYINVPFQKVVLTRKNILRRDNYKCTYCGRGDLPLTIDHVVPKARGGSDSWENLVAACTSCNNKKGDRSPAEANMKMLNRPYVPNHIIFIKNSVGKIDENWKPYLYLGD
ncbi:MAG: HNH endonuclease [Ignavibacteriaceae bacterium]|nr:HNH endonuclease [Ignavibacteriaceae bacterium]